MCRWVEMPRSLHVFGCAKSGKKSPPSSPPPPPTPPTSLPFILALTNGQDSADSLSEKSTFIVPYYVKPVISKVTKSVYDRCPAVGTRKTHTHTHTKKKPTIMPVFTKPGHCVLPGRAQFPYSRTRFLQSSPDVAPCD